MGNVFVSCKDEKTDFTELGKDEYPQIFGQWPDKKSNGDLGEFNLTLGDTLKAIGTYNVKLVVKTAKYETSREAVLNVWSR